MWPQSPNRVQSSERSLEIIDVIFLEGSLGQLGRGCGRCQSQLRSMLNERLKIPLEFRDTMCRYSVR
jgi:hypothetical protein